METSGPTPTLSQHEQCASDRDYLQKKYRALDSKYDDLKAEHDALKAEHESMKAEH